MANECRIGVFGTWRGNAYIRAFKDVENCKVTAICDRRPKVIEDALPNCPEGTKTFSDFDEFINSGLFDAVVMTNYFHEHAPFAIKAMEKGIHVLSETTAAFTMKECVDLCRAVERTGAKYMLAENYPFMCACQEMKRVYETGKLGKVIYADGEYVHPMSTNESDYYAPSEYHWRKYLPKTYYLTHSLAPLMYMTGVMPKSVNARTSFYPEYAIERGRMSGDSAGIMLCQMNDDSVFRVSGSCSFGPHGNWYRLGCVNGGIETIRGNQSNVRLEYNSWTTPEGEETSRIYTPGWSEHGELAAKAGHGGGDFWVAYNFVKYINEDIKPFFDVYKAAAMSAVGILGWKSVLEDGKTYHIPDFTKEEERKIYENDDLRPIPDENGNGMNLPCTSKEF